MISQKTIQPMEMVISAIHCLKERKGSSPKEILKYLENKYDVSAEALKIEVESGLKKGVSFGLINQRGGLYCLNEILRSPLKKPTTKSYTVHKVKLRKGNIGVKKIKLGKLTRKIGKPAYPLQSRKKKTQSSKTKRKIKPKKTIKGRNSRRQTDIRRQKLRQQKFKSDKTRKSEMTKKLNCENRMENCKIKNEASNKV